MIPVAELADETDSSERDDETRERNAEVAAFWEELGVDPVEIALPKGVGVTLRHYRTIMVTPEPPTAEASTATNKRPDDNDLDDDFDEDDIEAEGDAVEDEELEEPEPEEREDVVFLGQDGKVLLFRSEAGLVEFLKSDASHSFSELENFATLQKEVSEKNLVPAPEDSYELDLVVENLRGGHDSWDADLLIGAGEIARDIAQYADLPDVLSALSSGSPLDDLDEALRDGGFWARRRLRRVGAETAALAWRGVIGKLTATIEWRD